MGAPRLAPFRGTRPAPGTPPRTSQRLSTSARQRRDLWTTTTWASVARIAERIRQVGHRDAPLSIGLRPGRWTKIRQGGLRPCHQSPIPKHRQRGRSPAFSSKAAQSTHILAGNENIVGAQPCGHLGSPGLTPGNPRPIEQDAPCNPRRVHFLPSNAPKNSGPRRFRQTRKTVLGNGSRTKRQPTTWHDSRTFLILRFWTRKPTYPSSRRIRSLSQPCIESFAARGAAIGIPIEFDNRRHCAPDFNMAGASHGQQNACRAAQDDP